MISQCTTVQVTVRSIAPTLDMYSPRYSLRLSHVSHGSKESDVNECYTRYVTALASYTMCSSIMCSQSAVSYHDGLLASQLEAPRLHCVSHDNLVYPMRIEKMFTTSETVTSCRLNSLPFSPTSKSRLLANGGVLFGSITCNFRLLHLMYKKKPAAFQNIRIYLLSSAPSINRHPSTTETPQRWKSK